MRTKTLVAGGIAILAALLVGFLIGRTNATLPERGAANNPPQATTAQATSIPTSPVRASSGADVRHRCSEVEDELRRLKDRLRIVEAKAGFQEWMIGGLQEAAGEAATKEAERVAAEKASKHTPVPWPKDAPEKFQATSFEPILADAVRQSGLPIELASVSCDEPPCIAMLRLAADGKPVDKKWLQKLQSTDGWSGNYNNGISLWSGNIDCGDGRWELAAFVGKTWGKMDKQTQFRIMKRHKRRLTELIETWQCRSVE